MKILGRTQPLGRYPLDRCLSIVKQLGFDGVEVCLENADADPEQLDNATLAYLRLRLERLGLDPVSVSYHRDYVRDDAELSRTLEGIARAPELGAKVFIFSGGPGRSDDADLWARAVDRAGRLVEAARRAGVTAACEFEPGLVVGSTGDLLRLFHEIRSPHLAANLDLGHAFLCDDDPVTSIRRLGGRIAHGHVENMAAGVHDHLLPWEGDMDLSACLHALEEVGFTGGLALDLYRQDYQQVAPEAVRYLRSLLPVENQT